MFVNIANGCRVDSGYRLLNRCLRHVFDTKSESIINKKATLFVCVGESECENKVGIVLQNNIPASMKSNIYDVEVAVTKDDLMACRCDCQSGGTGNERVACVHVLPVLYQLTMLLYGGLAQHILIELSQRWNNNVESIVEGQKEKVVENILTLMRTEGDTETKINQAKKAPTISAMLKSFAVSTERMKLAIPPLPDPNELIPLRKLKLDSTTAKAKAVMNPVKKVY